MPAPPKTEKETDVKKTVPKTQDPFVLWDRFLKKYKRVEEQRLSTFDTRIFDDIVLAYVKSAWIRFKGKTDSEFTSFVNALKTEMTTKTSQVVLTETDGDGE